MKACAACLFACFVSPALHAAGSIEGQAEWLGSGDVKLLSGQAYTRLEVSPVTTLGIRLESALHEIDYRPNSAIDPLGKVNFVRRHRNGASLEWEQLSAPREYGISIGVYDGFRSHTSVWIDEYYRQQYSGGGIPGVAYEDPDPWGWSLTGFWKQDLGPSVGSIELSAAWLRDRVAPGYEIDDLGTSFALVRGEAVLETWTASLAWEGILNSRTRTRQQLRLTSTTGRELRAGWTGAVNVLLPGSWISRTAASWSRENPDFEAWSVSQTIEFSISSAWQVSLTARAYRDTGQIESANLVSSAAPGLQSRSILVGLRWTPRGGGAAVALAIGPYWSDYEETGIGTERFAGLYSDRDWWLTRLAFHWNF